MNCLSVRSLFVCQQRRYYELRECMHDCLLFLYDIGISSYVIMHNIFNDDQDIHFN